MLGEPEEGGRAGAGEAMLEELNEPQAAAAGHVDGPLLIFAGAGSGKTRVITYRVAHLLLCAGVPPYRILAVTFTNKAAAEMRRRLEALVSPELARDLWIGTFHAVCARLLRTHHAEAGLGRSFVIYDDSDQRALMARVLKDLGYDEKRYPPRQVLHRIHREKQEGRGPDDWKAESYMDDAIGKCFRAYQERLAGANAVDFEDLIFHVLRLAEDPESPAGADLRRRFRHVLVDEFQDTNVAQYRLVSALAREHGNLCVVGDDDQSIYRWRGADVRNIRGFRREFPGAAVVKLEQNYRSTAAIVKAALGVIRPSREREPKELWTARGTGSPVSVVLTRDEHDEASVVASRIKELEARGVGFEEVAVFYRVHAQSRVLEEVFRSERIPYRIVGGTKFFDRAEVKDLLAYLRVAVNPRSDVDLLRIINVPARKIGDSTVEKLLEVATAARIPVLEAIPLAVERSAVGAAAKKSLLAFFGLLEGFRKRSETSRPSELAHSVLEETGYLKLLEAEDSPEADARLQNLEELVGSISDYEAEALAAGESPSLSGYLERVSLAHEPEGEGELPRVSLMTVHAAKGLEFHAVFVTGMEEDLFPFRSAESRRDDDAEEERRLAYVALTRAREELTITHATRRMIFGQTRYGVPSRFLGDLPKDIVAQQTTPNAAFEVGQREARRAGIELGGSGFGSSAGRARGSFVHPMDRARAREPERQPGERYVEREEAGDPGEGGVRPGSPVRHPKFGLGTVLSVDPGHDPVVTVKFSGWGIKRIKANFLEGAGG